MLESRTGRVVLVTGGAGYIGSHVVRSLRRRGDRVVVVDDLSTGFAGRVPHVPFVHLDLVARGARERLVSTMVEQGVTGVLHFAALKSVSDSVATPTRYFDRNVGGLTNVLSAMEAASVDNLVFSSSAAVYGESAEHAVSEAAPCRPLNPYGQSKLVGEWMAAAAAAASGPSSVSLRYFNVAGADDALLADRSVGNLVPIVVDAVRHDRPVLLLGTDWDTPDGTCVRDYVHVLDLAAAHVAALDHLERSDRGSWVVNVGTGAGSSVLEVVRAVEAVSGLRARLESAPRRAGDPALVVADPALAGELLGWRAVCSLDDIVRSAWQTVDAPGALVA